MDASNISQRMRAMVTALGYSSCEKFEDEVGLGYGFVSRITRNVRKSSLDKIVLRFPQVNSTWIKTGKGDMFITSKVDKAPENNLTDRLNKFRLFVGKKKEDFEKEIGLFRGFLNRPTNTCTGPTLLKIKQTFPQININWLIYGVGEMLDDKDATTDYSEFTNYKDRIRTFCDHLGISTTYFANKCGLSRHLLSKFPEVPSETDMSLIAKAYPVLNMNWLKFGHGEMLVNEATPNLGREISFIPLVPQKAYAGYLNGFEDEEYVQSLPTIPFIKEGTDKYIAFEVSGDSMDDGSSRAYQDGDIVICKEIAACDVRDYDLPITKKEFVIVHTGGILLKQIKEVDKVTGTVLLHSFNPVYGNMEINLVDVRKIFTVEFQQKQRKR